MFKLRSNTTTIMNHFKTTELADQPLGNNSRNRDSVFQFALKHLPQIKSAEYGIESMERSLAMHKGMRSPRLYARGLLYTNYSDGLMNPVDPTQDYPIREQVNNNQYKQVSVGLSFPFFNRWQVQTNINAITTSSALFRIHY